MKSGVKIVVKHSVLGIVLGVLTGSLAGCQKGGSGSGPIPGVGISPATILSTTPAAGQDNANQSAPIQAVFSAPMNPASISTASFVIEYATNNLVQIAGSVSYDATTQTASFFPTSPLQASFQYRANLTADARDELGRALSPFSWTFTTIDPDPPHVISSTPGCGTENVDPGISVCALFSKRLDPATVGVGTFRVLLGAESGGGTPGGGNIVPGVVTLFEDGKTVCYTPNLPLQINNTYRLKVTDGIKDIWGDSVTPYTCQFRTLDTIAPKILSTNPNNGQSEVKPGIVIQAKFTEALAVPNLSPASFIVSDELGNPVSGGVSFDATTNTLNFTPDSRLLFGELYSAIVSGTVQDGGGNPLGQDYSWVFRTILPWNDLAFAETHTNAVDEARFAVNTNDGRTYAIWVQRQAGDTTTNVYVKAFTLESGWVGSSQSRLSANNNLGVSLVRIAVDSATGNVYTLWRERRTGDTIPCAYFSKLEGGNGSGWTAPLKLSAGTTSILAPSILVDSLDGTVYAGWAERAPTDVNYNAYLAINPGAGGPPAERISPDTSGIINLALSVDPQSHSLYAAWPTMVPGDLASNLYARVLQAGVWSPLVRVSDNVSAVSSSSFELLADPVANGAALIWIQNDNVLVSLFSALSMTWTVPVRVSDNTGFASEPRIAQDPSDGNFLVAWSEQAVNDASRRIYVSGYDALNGSWSLQVPLSEGTLAAVMTPSVTIEPSTGNAMVLWEEGYVIYSRQALNLFAPWEERLRVSDASLTSANPKAISFLLGDDLITFAGWLQENLGSFNNDLVSNLLYQ